jgi:4-amino-4-deoxy-L-arabinose transferase-like glycosyltransferase
MLLGTEGMIAKTDGALAGFTTLALAALAQLYGDPKRPKALAMLFWAAMGAAMLIKGPVAPLVVLLTLCTLGVWERRWAWMAPLLWWPGPLLAALMVAPWMIAIGVATDGAFFAEAIGEDLAPKLAGGAEGHFAWPGYHLALLALLIFPATFALPAAARLAWRTARTPRDNSAPLRFLVAWAVPSFLLFELAPTKLAHYVLPTYPAIALLCGAALLVAGEEKQKLTRLAGIVLFTLAGLALVGLVAWSATYMPGDVETGFRRATQAALAGGGLLLVALAAMMFAPRPIVQAAAAALLAVSLSYSLRERILPEARTLHVSVEAEAALRRARLLPNAEHQLYVVGYGEMSLVFLTRTGIRIVSGADLAAEAQVGDSALIEERHFAESEAALNARDLAFEPESAPVEGHNYGNGDAVLLHVGRIAPANSSPEAAADQIVE